MQLLRITIRDNNIIKNSESSSKGKAHGGGGIFPKRKHVAVRVDCGVTATQATGVASTILYNEINISPFLIGSNPRQILQN